MQDTQQPKVEKAPLPKMSPATQEVVGADRYDVDVLAQSADVNYGAMFHDVYGAVSWAKLTNHKYADRTQFTHDEMKEIIDGYLQQEDLTHKAALEARSG